MKPAKRRAESPVSVIALSAGLFLSAEKSIDEMGILSDESESSAPKRRAKFIPRQRVEKVEMIDELKSDDDDSDDFEDV